MVPKHYLLFMPLGLIWAAGRGFSEVVKVLLDAGAKVDVGDKVSKLRFVHGSNEVLHGFLILSSYLLFIIDISMVQRH